MSDAALIIIVPSLISAISGVIIVWLNTRQNKAIKTKVDSVDGKVAEYHKEVNGKMEKLLVTTEALGAERGKAEEKENPTKK